MNEQKTYEQGINDFAEYYRLYIDMETEDRIRVFGANWGVLSSLLSHVTPIEFVKRMEAYKENLMKPKLGDVVVIEYGSYAKEKVIFLWEGKDEYDVLFPDTECPLQVLIKGLVKSITKTGEHLDIRGMLDKLA